MGIADYNAQRETKVRNTARSIIKNAGATTFVIAVFENSKVMYSYSNIFPKDVLVYLVTCAESCGGWSVL